MATHHLTTQNYQLTTYDGYISESDADRLYEHIMTLPIVQYPTGKLYGKSITFHRGILFVSDISQGYTYSGQTAQAVATTPLLNQLLTAINTSLSTSFNGILINVYYTGDDYISQHSDNEKDLYNGTVACISVGSHRNFRVIHKTDKTKLDIQTKHGQLLLMSGDFQKYYTHGITVDKAVTTPRISLTFRYHSKRSNSRPRRRR